MFSGLELEVMNQRAHSLAIDPACGGAHPTAGHSFVYPSPARSDTPMSSLKARALRTPASLLSSSPTALVRPRQPSSPEPQSNHGRQMLGQSLANAGLHLDIGLHNGACWSRPPEVSLSYIDIAPSLTAPPVTTVAPMDLCSHGEQLSTDKLHDHSGTQSHYEPGLAQSPESWVHEQSISLTDNDGSSSVENKFYDFEPCDLAISSGDEFASPAALDMVESPGSTNLPAEYSAAKRPSPRIKVEHRESERDSASDDDESVSDDIDFREFIKTEPSETKPKRCSQEAPRYFCPFCGKPFPRKFNYSTHLQTHDPYRSRPYRCDVSGCCKSFYRPNDLRRHDQSVCKTLHPRAMHLR